jgi:shikimate kinase
LVDLDDTQPAIILATGGGAFTHEETRKILKKHCLTIWLQGDIDTIFERISRNNKRPLLQVADPRAKLQELIEARHPIYGEAHLHVPIAKGPHIRTVNRVIRAVTHYIGKEKKQSA